MKKKLDGKFTVKIVDDKNFDDFLYLVKKLAEHEKLDPPDKKAQVRLRKDALSKPPKYAAYLGLIDGKPVSYIIFLNIYSSFLAKPTLFLEDIFVLEDYRKKGIGSRLFSFCAKEAKKRKCGRIEWYVLNRNKKAIAFYDKIGAHKPEWTLYRLDEDNISRLAK